MKEEDEDYELQKPHMQNIKDEKHMEDFIVNTILIFNLQMINKYVSNNYKSERFGMHIFEDDLSRVLVKLAQSSGVFTQSSYLLA
jgi:hypothetical protein